MTRSRGPTLLVLIAAGWLAFLWSRGFLQSQELPAPFVPSPCAVRVELAAGFPDSCVHQFFDAPAPEGVIGLTLPGISLAKGADPAPLQDGERVDLLISGQKAVEIQRSWMSAAKRLALGIPLVPERMTAKDWEALPGIGPGLARRIEQDRQINGDFGSLEALERVKGIGPKRLATLREFFQNPQVAENK